MDLTSKKTIRKLLKQHQTQALKKLGQNFLIDKKIIKKIIAELILNLHVLEIGPGIGVLTAELAKRTKKVIAVEKDLKMVEILKETIKEIKNIEVIKGDILKLNLNSLNLKSKKYQITASLPFHIVSPTIRKFLESEIPPQQMILVVQKEIAQRICAKLPHLNILAIAVQFYGKPDILGYISKKSFWPSPKVDGAILKISKICPKFPGIDSKLFFRIVKAGFSTPRKQLLNSLSQGLKIDKKIVKDWLLKNKIQPSLRPENLKLEDWVRLTESIN